MRGSLRRRTALPVALLLAVLLAAPARAGALSRDLHALSLAAGGQGRVDVIVTYAASPGPAQEERLRGHGADRLRRLHLVRGVAANLPVGRRERLAPDPEVRSVAFDERVSAATDVVAPTVGAFLAREALAIDGRGARVAVIDSGVAPVADLGAGPDAPLGRIAAWVDLVEPYRNGPGDPYGHGTHVAGIIAGALHEVSEPGSRRLYGGMAPAAEIVSVRVLDRDGQGRASDVIAGIEWVVQHGPELGVRVVNLSLGHPVRETAATDPLVQAVERAADAGFLVVVSAGNLGRLDEPLGTITSPGNAPHALTVGALVDQDSLARGDDVVATYSSLGPTRFDGLVKPDLLAPGDAVVALRSPHSTLDRGYPDNRVGSDSRGADAPELFELSGTSMSAAVASGAAALLLSADPTLDARSLKARLMRSAEKRAESIYARGAGALDVMAALEDGGLAGAAASPTAIVDGAHVLLENSESWGADWSVEALYGPPALWDLDLAWDSLQVVESAEQDDKLVWQLPPAGEPGTEVRWERAPSPSPQSVVWQLRSESVVWQDKARLQAESVVWQNDARLQAESVVWQSDARLQAESVVWQSDARLQAESVVWQSDSRLQAESVVWQSDSLVQAESVVWQFSSDATDILIHGDGDHGR